MVRPSSENSLTAVTSLLPSFPFCLDEAVALHGDGGAALPPVGCCLIKLLAQPELQLYALHSGLRDHRPVASGLADGHHGGGGHGGLPQHETHIELLEEILVSLL